MSWNGSVIKVPWDVFIEDMSGRAFKLYIPEKTNQAGSRKRIAFGYGYFNQEQLTATSVCVILWPNNIYQTMNTQVEQWVQGLPDHQAKLLTEWYAASEFSEFWSEDPSIYITENLGLEWTYDGNEYW